MARYATGAPCWVDLGSPDVDASARFYEALFGWTSEASGPEYGGYTNFYQDGQRVGAVGPLMGPGQPAVWTTYFHTDDVVGLAAKVAGAGGTVLAPPMEIPPFGFMAIFLDQEGATFGAWQPKEMHGADLMREDGAPSWFELLARDVAGSREFYSAVLGLTARELTFEDGGYTLLETGGESVAGLMGMRGFQLPPDAPPRWVVYFAVADPDAVADRCRDLNGSVPVPPMDMEAGRFAWLADPHGSAFAVIRPDPDYRP